MIGHDNKGIELIQALASVPLQRFDKEERVGFSLEDALPVSGDGRNKESARYCSSLWPAHGRSL